MQELQQLFFQQLSLLNVNLEIIVELDKAKFLLQITATLVLFLIVYKFAWPSFIKAIDKRAEQVNSDIKQAELDKIAADQLKADYQLTLKGIGEEKDLILKDAKKIGQQEKDSIILTAHEMSSEIIKRTKAESINIQKQAQLEIEREMIEYVNLIAGKFINEQITEEEELKTLEQAVGALK